MREGALVGFGGALEKIGLRGGAAEKNEGKGEGGGRKKLD